MRKITVFSMLTLDGVIQSPGGPKEDTSGGFKYGGWVAPYGDDDFNRIVREELDRQDDYLLGRKTFEIWAAYWPLHADIWSRINEGMKYVYSKKRKKSDRLITGWEHSTLLKSPAEIRKLKTTKGPNLQVWGSSKLIQLLLKNDLVDELRLKIYPLTLGKGKKLFQDGAIPAAFKLTESVITSKGVIVANYKRAGKVKTGDMAGS